MKEATTLGGCGERGWGKGSEPRKMALTIFTGHHRDMRGEETRAGARALGQLARPRQLPPNPLPRHEQRRGV